MWQAFWAWYERHYILNVSFALGLFALQIAHLFWLFCDVILARLLGAPFFDVTGLSQFVIILVDYTEIPAIFTMTLVYIDVWRRGQKAGAALMLFLLHMQWLHLFWITDEFVVDSFTHTHAGETVLPVSLAWVAILIDYLEVPVIFDTARRLYRAVIERRGMKGINDVLQAPGL